MLPPMDRSPVRAAWWITRLVILWLLGCVAAVSMLTTVAGLAGRKDHWTWLNQIGQVPWRRPGVFSRTDVENLTLAGGGVRFTRTATIYAGTGVMVFDVQKADGSAVSLKPGEGPVHTGDWSGDYPSLPAARPSERVEGFSWMGVARIGDSFGVVVPLPVVALVTGTWPALIALRWWRRRRRGENESGFEVVPTPRGNAE